MKNRERDILIRVWFSSLVLFGLIGWFFTQIHYGQKNKFEIYTFFLYFTIQTNIFVFLYLIFWKTKFAQKVRTGVLLLIMVTGSVYWIVIYPLVGFESTITDQFNIWVHLMTPILMLYTWISTRSSLTKKDVFYYINIYAVIYLTIVYFSNYIIAPLFDDFTDNFYPYPFLDPNKVHVGIIILIIISLFALFNAICYTLLKIDYRYNVILLEKELDIINDNNKLLKKTEGLMAPPEDI